MNVRLVWKGRLARRVALALAFALVAGTTAVVLWPRSSPVHVTAYFPRTVGIHPGSDVRVLGVRVGEVGKITPEGGRVRVELEYEPGRRIPADAQAAIINSSVVSDRYVQLLPVYRGGPAMKDGAVIPLSRTAVPVELDRVFDSLHTTAEALGPKGANADGSLSRLLGVSADNLDGQGAKLHQTVEDLSLAVTTLSDGRQDLFGTVRNLQVFTAALAADDRNVRSFNDSLAQVADQLMRRTQGPGGGAPESGGGARRCVHVRTRQQEGADRRCEGTQQGHPSAGHPACRPGGTAGGRTGRALQSAERLQPLVRHPRHP